jgi:hypothetical protein
MNPIERFSKGIHLFIVYNRNLIGRYVDGLAYLKSFCLLLAEAFPY